MSIQKKMQLMLIRKVLMEENQRFWESFHKYAYYEVVEFHLKESKRLMNVKISEIRTYEQAEEFIHNTRRISLDDWINSL